MADSEVGRRVPAERPAVLILGALGQAGHALVETTAAAGRDPATVLAWGRDDLDIRDAVAVNEALQRLRPHAVINCTVFQPVDRCETEPEEAFGVNSIAAGNLARGCRAVGSRLVHLSTDYVFSGPRRRPFLESHRAEPLNVYGASKLAGEHLVLAASPVHMVIRTSCVFGRPHTGHGNRSFVERMYARALRGEPTLVVNDQVVSPTSATDLAAGIWYLLGCGATGLFHVAGDGECSWYRLARQAFRAAGVLSLVRPTTAAEYGAAAPRAAYTALGSERAGELGLRPLPPWRESVAAYLESLAHP